VQLRFRTSAAAEIAALRGTGIRPAPSKTTASSPALADETAPPTRRSEPAPPARGSETAPPARTAEPAPPAHATEPARGSQSDEIVLEGDWDPTAAPVPVMPAAPRDVPVGAAAVPIVREESARERATAKLAAAGALPKSQTGGRGVLQYSKVEARPGFMTSELGQQPWWIQAGVWLLGLVVFALIGWAVYRGVMWMRAGPEGGTAVEQDGESPR
jgi:hypothetical protein